MSKKTEKDLQEYIKLKNKLELLNTSASFEKKTKNPFEALTFNEANFGVEEKRKTAFVWSYKFWFSLLVLLLLTVSVLFNSAISLRFDPVLYKVISNLSALINKPYVVTVGNFESFEIAKSKAIELLPRLKQINIKQLPTGNYTFEIEKCGSKENAYSIAGEFTHGGFGPVNVRYLPGQ